jgi:hypothetical protein
MRHVIGVISCHYPIRVPPNGNNSLCQINNGSQDSHRTNNLPQAKSCSANNSHYPDAPDDLKYAATNVQTPAKWPTSEANTGTGTEMLPATSEASVQD